MGSSQSRDSKSETMPVATGAGAPSRSRLRTQKPTTNLSNRPSNLPTKKPTSKVDSNKSSFFNPTVSSSSKAINAPKSPIASGAPPKYRPQNVKLHERLLLKTPSRSNSQFRPPGNFKPGTKPDPVNIRHSESIHFTSPETNNNNVWTRGIPASSLDREGSEESLGDSRQDINIKRGQASSSKGQESTLKGAPSVSSLDSKHHKIAPSKDKSLKIFGSKEKLNKSGQKKKESLLEQNRYASNNNAIPDENDELGTTENYKLNYDFEGNLTTNAKDTKEYGSADDVVYSGFKVNQERLIGGGRSSPPLLHVSERLLDEHGDVKMSQECVSLPVNVNTVVDHVPTFQDINLHAASEAHLIASSMQELDALRRELEASERDKAELEARVAELSQRCSETDELRSQLEKMKAAEQQRMSSLERLADENGALRARLRGVAHSPLSDSEKRQLLLEPTATHHRMHSSAPPSIALTTQQDGEGTEVTTPEWDKHSSSSLSEVSVACLQDRILQMEENHYSTSEELQATIAELADLQSQLADAHADNERLSDEKQVLLESLCRQTERLEDSRTKISQEDRANLLAKQEELNAEASELRSSLEAHTKENERLQERVRLVEESLECAQSEKAQAEREGAAARELAAGRQHQLTTLTELLDAAKAKLSTVESELVAGGTAAEARREADAAAARAASLAERLAHSQRQLDRAQQHARIAQDDAAASRNNAKSTISELEFQCEQLKQDKSSLQAEVKVLQDTVNDLQVQCQLGAEEKRQVMGRVSEALARAADAERQLQDARTRYAQLVRDRERDEAEWKQFQSDLLMTVRVANDFKTEAQRELERLVSENRTAREKIRHLEQQIENIKAMPPPLTRTEESQTSVSPSPLLTSASLQDIMASAQSQRRNKGVSRQDSRLSVKSLIDSIESAAKVAKQQQSSASAASSASSLAGSAPTTPPTDWPQPSLTINSTTAHPLKSALSDAAPATQPTVNNGSLTPSSNGYSSPTTNGKPPHSRSPRSIIINTEGGGAALGSGAKLTNLSDDQTSTVHSLLQQNKAIESFVRRNSYGDLCERKDPLNALQVKNGGSKRNALLKWCQQTTQGYKNIDITNFSSSWNDGLALCALMHSYLGSDRVPYDALVPSDKRTNFSVAFAAAEAVGIPTTLNIQDMIQLERPDWQQVMAYVTSIYKHFES